MPDWLTASCCCALTTTGTRRAFADAAAGLASSAVLPTKDPFALKVCIDRAIGAIRPSNAVATRFTRPMLIKLAVLPHPQAIFASQ